MYHRLKDGRTIFDSDRLHLHYRLVDSGIEAPSGRVLFAGNVLVVGLGLVLTTISPALSLFVFVALGAVYANWNALRIRTAWITNTKHSRRRFDTL